MQLNFQIVMKRIYPFIFALAFWGISIIPMLKGDISIATFENNFLGHDKLIEYFNTLRMGLGDRVFPNTIIGKDGWLFYTADRSIDDYQGTNPYTPNQLREIGNKFDALNSQLQQKGVLLIVIIAPDKNTIYPQYLPGQIVKIGNQSRLDQFVDYMHQYRKTTVIDLRSDLITASKTEQVYYKTDTHWNPSAEYIAYAKIMSVLSQRYPKLVAHPLFDYRVVDGGLVTFGIPDILGMPNLKEDSWTLQPKFEAGTNFRQIPSRTGILLDFPGIGTRICPALLFTTIPSLMELYLSLNHTLGRRLRFFAPVSQACGISIGLTKYILTS